jgi:hypothetical protein
MVELSIGVPYLAMPALEAIVALFERASIGTTVTGLSLGLGRLIGLAVTGRRL